jgi:outer membrane protein OmpA-like peptidoglycan-associated protein
MPVGCASRIARLLKNSARSNTMFEKEDDGTRIGVFVALGVVLLLLFGLIGGLAIRQLDHKAAPAAAGDALLDAPLSGEIAGVLYFALGSADLPADAPGVVAAAAKMVGEAPAGAKLVLSGFHDASGDPAKNAELAKNRAKAVRAALLAGGTDAARVALRKPEVTTGDGSAQEARRVEIRLVK